MDYLVECDVLKRRDEFIHSKILTQKQCDVLKKRSKGEELSVTEKTYYYKFIRPKLKAISGSEEFAVTGKEHILAYRIKESVDILRQLQYKHKNQKLLISGSFLFKEKYNDIDVFVVSKYTKKNYRFKNMQISFLKDKDLNSLFFSSLAQISVTNFQLQLNYTPLITIDEFAKNYELLINALLQKEDLEPYLRTFLLQATYLSTGAILNPLELSLLRERYIAQKSIKFIRQNAVYAFCSGYNVSQRVRLQEYVQDYKVLGKKYKSVNLLEYIKTYEEVIKSG